MFLSFLGIKNNTDALVDDCMAAGRAEAAGGRVAREADQIAGKAVCREQPASVRREGDITRMFASGGNALNDLQFAVPSLQNDDLVCAAHRDIQEPVVR